MPSSHLILCCPLLLLPPISSSIRVFSNESTLHMRWPKYWSFSFYISPSNEHPGLISFRMDWLDLLAVQGTLKSLLQHHRSKASILRRSAFFTVQLSHPYMTTGKTIALTRRTFVGKVMSLLFRSAYIWSKFILISFGCMPRSITSRSYGRPIFNFWDPSIFSMHPHWTFSFSPHLCQHLLSPVFLMIAILTVWDNISWWFWFAFLWCLEILSIFSHISCLFWCLLWEKESIFSYSALSKIRLFGVFCLFVIKLTEFFMYFG